MPCLDRSEEHTSELQLRFDLLCRLVPPRHVLLSLSLHDALPISLRPSVWNASCTTWRYVSTSGPPTSHVLASSSVSLARQKSARSAPWIGESCTLPLPRPNAMPRQIGRAHV